MQERLTAAQVSARGLRPGQSMSSYVAELNAAVCLDQAAGVPLPEIEARKAGAAQAAGASVLHAPEMVEVPLPSGDVPSYQPVPGLHPLVV